MTQTPTPDPVPDDADVTPGSEPTDVPDGAAVCQELQKRNVIVDHRPNAGIRIAPHFYTTDGEIDHAIETIDAILAG